MVSDDNEDDAADANLDDGRNIAMMIMVTIVMMMVLMMMALMMIMIKGNLQLLSYRKGKLSHFSSLEITLQHCFSEMEFSWKRHQKSAPRSQEWFPLIGPEEATSQPRAPVTTGSSPLAVVGIPAGPSLVQPCPGWCAGVLAPRAVGHVPG